MKKALLILSLAAIITGCNDDDDKKSNVIAPVDGTPITAPITEPQDPQEPQEPDQPLYTVEFNASNFEENSGIVLGNNHVKALVDGTQSKPKAIYAWYTAEKDSFVYDYDITFEHTADSGTDGFINIYMECNGEKVRAELFNNNVYSVDHVNYNHDEFIDTFGKCNIRNNYYEFGLSYGSNFIYRSSGTNEVVAGDEVTLKFDVKYNVITELPFN